MGSVWRPAMMGWAVAAACAGWAAGAELKDLPEADRKFADTVDPWGLPFSDSLRRWNAVFAPRPEALFAAGVTHDLVKVWPVKYWFRGQTFLSQAAGSAAGGAEPLWAAAGTTAAFQVAALPRIGIAPARFTLAVEAARLPVQVFREVFVICPPAAYPRLGSDRWPDPLVPASEATAEGTDLALFWVDVAIPVDHPGGTVICRVTVNGQADGRTETARVDVPLRIVPGLDLKPKDGMKLTAWFTPQWPGEGKARKPMAAEVFQRMAELALAHHVQPANVLEKAWDPKRPEAFDERHAFYKQRGQNFFHLGAMTPELYQHLEARGIVDEFAVYGVDEPSPEMIAKQAIPRYESLKKQFPKLRVYMASEPWPELDKACDFFMTDLSSHLYDPRTYKPREHPRLWHYYCHLPIRWQARAPLPLAPNMQIDNPAVEHRIALWMSHHWGGQGIFIWNGNSWDLAADLWTTGRLGDKPYAYPYAGVHNGNGFLVIHSPAMDDVYPTVRLKVLRAGMEDLALLRAAAGRTDLVNPVPALFVHPHYFDRLPETLLARRQAILEALAGGR